MLVPALNLHVGYNNAAKVARKAHADGTTLKQACLDLGVLSAADFDKYIKPADMV